MALAGIARIGARALGAAQPALGPEALRLDEVRGLHGRHPGQQEHEVAPGHVQPGQVQVDVGAHALHGRDRLEPHRFERRRLQVGQGVEVAERAHDRIGPQHRVGLGDRAGGRLRLYGQVEQQPGHGVGGRVLAGKEHDGDIAVHVLVRKARRILLARGDQRLQDVARPRAQLRVRRHLGTGAGDQAVDHRVQPRHRRVGAPVLRQRIQRQYGNIMGMRRPIVAATRSPRRPAVHRCRHPGCRCPRPWPARW